MRARARAGFFVDLDRSRPDGNGGLSCRSSRPARKGSSFIRRRTIAGSMPKCTPPGRNAISICGSIAPSAATRPGFAGSASARSLVCRAGRRKRSRSRRTLEYLLKHCWQAQITVSLPRLRPAAGGFRPLFSMSDRELAQLVCALRITFPQVGIVLSTRERAPLRDALTSLGVTMMSAGSHTEPGGYTRQGTRTSASHRARAHRCARIPGRRRPARHRPIRDQRRTFAGRNRRCPSPAVASSRSGKIGTRRFCASMNDFTQWRPVDAREAKTIAELVERYQLPPQSILVEHNGLALHRHEWPERAAGRRRPHRIHSSRRRRINELAAAKRAARFHHHSHSVRLNDGDRCLRRR